MWATPVPFGPVFPSPSQRSRSSLVRVCLTRGDLFSHRVQRQQYGPPGMVRLGPTAARASWQGWLQQGTTRHPTVTPHHQKPPSAFYGRRRAGNAPQPQGNVFGRHPPPTAIASLLTTSSSFNPLFRVLFVFPSRYLFAIGLLPTCLALDGVYHPVRAALSSSPTLRALLIGVLGAAVSSSPTGISPSLLGSPVEGEGAPFQVTWRGTARARRRSAS